MTAVADAIALLEADHNATQTLFARYRELALIGAPAAQRKNLAEDICTTLAVHTRLEEELFYPAVREALDDDDIVDEAEDAHSAAQNLVAQLLALRAEDPLYDAKVAVLSEYVARHVRQEREQIFPRLRLSGLDLRALGMSLSVRKDELQAVSQALREHALATAVL
ncbi:hemerythrin domain-containing protein [Ramlibacter sp.]|uniref:hemerythrin domain-containing protein n=1 Tax=Ramlibacter sp. TaxID=1917967 RepID=UPI0017E7FDC2|nr:hemerythrin domain-containing protein [Ramlibacter sp.]MBA2672847.1 hemerythrin domain-containing protein [Ramlibacter sp.]